MIMINGIRIILKSRNQMASYTYLFKYIIVGDSSVGKSCLLLQFTDQRFKAAHDLTIGVEFGSRTIQVDPNNSVKLQIWDTAGQESFNKLHPSYYYGAHACIMVFDATRKVTYENLKIWYSEMRSHCPHIPCIVIANKIDLDPRTTKRSYKYIEDLKLPFNFVSAADGTNVV